MTRKPSSAEAQRQRKMAAHLFNDVWRLLKQKQRSQEDVDTMIHMAHASRYHWGLVGGPKELSIGEWQVSHVYAVLRRAEPSLYHAKRCLDICERHGITDFPLAYAHEALARAFAIAGKPRLRERHLHLARVAAANIAKDEDRTLLLQDLRTVPRARTG